MRDKEPTDLLDLIRLEDEKANGVRKLFTAEQREDLTAYQDDFDAWTDQYGHMGSLAVSHAWTPQFAYSRRAQLQPTEVCTPVMLTSDTRCDHYRQNCFCLGDLLYRTACRHCGWHSPIAAREQVAVLDGLDHCYPGWRESPVVSEYPAGATKGTKAHIAWESKVRAAYGDRPTGWPVITDRDDPTSRRVIGNRSPWGGHEITISALDD